MSIAWIAGLTILVVLMGLLFGGDSHCHRFGSVLHMRDFAGAGNGAGFGDRSPKDIFRYLGV